MQWKDNHLQNTMNYSDRIIYVILVFLIACSQQQASEEGSHGVTAIGQFPEVKDQPDQRTIPQLLFTPGGDSIKTLQQWQDHRDYIIDMLSFYQYGEMPPKPGSVKVVETSKVEVEDRIHNSYDFTLRRNGQTLAFRVGLIRPAREGTYPIIIKNDRYRFDMHETENERSREKYAKQNRLTVDFWVADKAIKREYIYCKFIREDVALDVNGPKRERIFALYPEYDWGAITAWAWTYQIIIDWLEQQSFVDKDKIIATGHSRGGKTALCAGIFDERIAITVPNSSGIGGTGSLRFYDFTKGDIQTIDHHAERFRHWWPERWYTLKDHIEKVPFDMHFAKALIAPRALLNTHARHDFWANPFGTYLTFLKSQKAFDLYGVNGNNAIHWRDGGHAQDKEDWLALFDYCDLIFFQKPTNRDFGQNPFPGQYQFDSLDAHDVTKRSQQ